MKPDGAGHIAVERGVSLCKGREFDNFFGKHSIDDMNYFVQSGKI